MNSCRYESQRSSSHGGRRGTLWQLLYSLVPSLESLEDRSAEVALADMIAYGCLQCSSVWIELVQGKRPGNMSPVSTTQVLTSKQAVLFAQLFRRKSCG